MKSLFSFLLFTAFSLALHAQGSEAMHIKVSVVPTDKLDVGDKVTLTIEATPKGDWYIYSAVPSEEQAYMPTVIAYNLDSRGFTAAEEIKEEGYRTDEYDDIMAGMMRYYKGKAVFTQQLTITEPEVIVTGDFDYMSCNGEKCVMFTETFKVTLTANE